MPLKKINQSFFLDAAFKEPNYYLSWAGTQTEKPILWERLESYYGHGFSLVNRTDFTQLKPNVH